MQGVSKKQQSLVSQNADNKSPNQQITEEKKRNPKQSLILSQQTQKNTKGNPSLSRVYSIPIPLLSVLGYQNQGFCRISFLFFFAFDSRLFLAAAIMADDNTDLKDEVAEVFFFPYFFFFINQHFFFALICFIYMFSFNDEKIENKASKMTRESAFLSFCCLIKS